jgi:two-component system chemotaxis response regulator CheB
MPMSAMQQVVIDHCLSVAGIGSLLQGLAMIRPKGPRESPSDKERMRKEVSIAAGGNAFEKGVTEFGDYTPFTCPECDGVLIRILEGANSRYRCHTGHAYSGTSLLSGIAERIEAGYWSVMRSLEETAMLLDEMSGVLVADEENEIASALRKEASLAKRQSKRILAMALEQGQAATYVAAGANKPKRRCTGSGCLDTALQLRRPASTGAPDGLRGAT